MTQLSSVTTAGISTESYSFDSEGRVNSKTLTLTSRPSHPFVNDYIYDELDRVKDVRYSAEYGNGTQPRKVVHHDYDVASRLTGLTVDGQSHASQAVYNAASQTTQLKVGVSGANQITENYGYHTQTGLLDNQTVVRGGAANLLSLSYDYTNANGKRTGQLTKIVNNLNNNKDRSYSYDALGRLTQAKGGPSGSLWTQTYSYDRYGNRTGVSATGSSARNRGSSPTEREGSSDVARVNTGTANTGTANTGSAGVSPAMSAQREAASPKVMLPPEQLAARTDIELHDSLRVDAPRPISDSSFNLGSKPTNPPPVTSAPQGSPVFTDDPLVAGVTVIKAVHITELRNAVNQARARAGLPAASWAEAIGAGVVVKAAPIVELRGRLDEARAALGLPAANYTDPSLSAGMTVKAAHVQELRQRVTEALGSLPMAPDGHTSLSFDAATNRITTAGFAYDAAGNQVRALAAAGGSQRFQYDAANRLVRVKTDDNQTVIAGYSYGDSNERLIGEEGGLRTYYACDGKAEYTESGSSTTPQWSKSYIYLGGRLLSTLTPNGSGGEAVQYHHPDRLGTRFVTNAQDTTSFEQVTLPFGTALNAESTGSTNRRFTSYDRSTMTGLDYALNRHYDPQQGRFTQVDPIGMGAASPDDPQSLNMYAYCGNDPINHIDPEGLFFKKLFKFLAKVVKWVLVVAAVVAAVAAVLILTGYVPAIVSGWKLLAASGIMFGMALGPEWLQKRISFVAGFPGLSGGLTSGTPPWNPNARGSRGFGGFGWDDEIDVITTTTSCRNNWPLPDGLNCPGASWFKKLVRGIEAARNFTAGAIDEGMLFGSFYRRLLGGGGEENTTGYKAGRWTAFAGTLVIPGGGQVGGAAKLGQKAFAPGRWLSHFQSHGAEFGYKTSVEYLRGAQSLIGRSGIRTMLRGGDQLFYDVARNEFAVLGGNGYIRTFFKPREGLKYWIGQGGK
ncbi:MAG: RHS repeat-associated core domain-containing protein [Pyrinomonadaceae bacterium]